ncbi:MAG: hypothetical protein ACXVH0_03425, partial [Thermoanaerobaculia bacterium]
QEGITDAARQVARGAVLDRSPYLKMAFTNPYNLSLFAGALAAAGLTLNPVLAVVALGLEGLWLLHAPDNTRLKHLLWDPKFEKLRKAMEAQERAQRLTGVDDEDRRRVDALVARQEEIRRLAAQNPSFTGELLRNELVKTDRLVNAFVEMAVTCSRYEAYLGSIDADALEKDRRRYEQAAKGGEPADPRTTIAKKNLSIVGRRLEKVQEIRSYLSVACGQLDLIENSFQLIADQIVTMQSPQELSGQLDELLDGVEAIRQTAQDTDKILSGIGIEREI